MHSTCALGTGRGDAAATTWIFPGDESRRPGIAQAVFLEAYEASRELLDYDRLELRPFLPGALVATGSSLARVGDPLRRPGELVGALTGPIGSLGDKLRAGALRVGCLALSPTAIRDGKATARHASADACAPARNRDGPRRRRGAGASHSARRVAAPGRGDRFF